MKPVVIDNVKGKDLPQGWADRAGVRPDEEVQITIGPSREDAAQELVRLMDYLRRFNDWLRPFSSTINDWSSISPAPTPFSTCPRTRMT